MVSNLSGDGDGLGRPRAQFLVLVESCTHLFTGTGLARLWLLVGVPQFDGPALEDVAQPHPHHLLPLDLLEVRVFIPCNTTYTHAHKQLTAAL